MHVFGENLNGRHKDIVIGIVVCCTVRWERKRNGRDGLDRLYN